MPAISHHYLPQVYLRRFTPRDNRKLLWKFDKSTGASIESSPKNCGCEDYYHAFKRNDGTLDTDSIELDLGRIETKIDSVYEAIRMQRPFSAAEWRAFHVFAGSMSVRVPAFIDRFHKFASDVLEYGFEITKTTPEFIKRSQELGVPPESLANIKATADRDFSLLMCLEAMHTPIELFSKMQWQFVQSSGANYFITGDNPVFHCVPDRDPGTIFPPGLADKDIEITFPMSRTTCAVGAWRPSKVLYRNVGEETIQLINARTAAAALRYLYSPTRTAKEFERRSKQAMSNDVINCWHGRAIKGGKRYWRGDQNGRIRRLGR